MNLICIDELNRNGWTKIGKLLTREEIQLYRDKLIAHKFQDINQYGEDALITNGDFETVRDLTRFNNDYLAILENKNLNEFLNISLNDTAIVHSYNGIITQPSKKSEMLGFKFHRDQPFFESTRTSLIIMIPLVDISKENGATQILPSSHLISAEPSSEFFEKHHFSIEAKAGEGFCIDSTLWHRAGKNESNFERPMIVIKYTLAFIKQQINFFENGNSSLYYSSPLVKKRLGWDSRTPSNYIEFRAPPGDRKWKSGQYNMQNTKIK
ncbi:phytanoyl-CoA dioxygenase family protein [Polynucleobacter sp. AP-Sanab-80-C2]|uniref:phytanoyl-CoA dioxygenase family protein n=1 Tax=Polynucleobacter sp. AP-Sanab-80-C2 TaxID=3108274 RepID=UPI002B237A83|nr:phytanoyl-CoA dioxygenase family protein [Polynucleobacter sp. AP-Sanab-80-C2]MEA9598562.1 phytanoyl-CoA dioxygenase family protein [Polynucleobacter sp. AP-Sanab-80-C2]